MSEIKKVNEEMEESKQLLLQYKEEHSVEIRESKRRQILNKNRVSLSKDMVGIQEEDKYGEQRLTNASTGKERRQDELKKDMLRYVNCQTQEQFEGFLNEFVSFQRNSGSEIELNTNVNNLLTALLLTMESSVYFFSQCAEQLFIYFKDEERDSNIEVNDMYRYINMIISSGVLEQIIVSTLGNWQQLICSSERERLLGCMKIMCAVSRGSEAHCQVLEDLQVLGTFFEIFDHTKMERDFSQIMIYTIGNIAATNSTWKSFYMQLNFHNIILAYLKYAPKNDDNLVLHRRICWCLSNFTRDCNKDESESFDFTHINNLYETYQHYDDTEIRIDISWTFTQLLSIFFSKDYNGKNGIYSEMKYNLNEVLMQDKQKEKTILSQKILYLMQNNLCHFMEILLSCGDMTTLVPVLRGLNKILIGGSNEVLILFFQQMDQELFVKRLNTHIQSRQRIIRRETTKIIHSLLTCDYVEMIPNWFNSFMPIVLTKLAAEDPQIKEEVFKILNSIIGQINIGQFEEVVFSKIYSLFHVIRISLATFETRVETIATIINILITIMHKYQPPFNQMDAQRASNIINLIDSNQINIYIEKLQSHQLSGIYELALQFVETYNTLTNNIPEDDNCHLNQSAPHLQQDIQIYPAQQQQPHRNPSDNLHK